MTISGNLTCKPVIKFSLLTDSALAAENSTLNSWRNWPSSKRVKEVNEMWPEISMYHDT